ncbi:MAG: murein hydrolase activator EnvC family protein [Myxococcota bacterium]
MRFIIGLALIIMPAWAQDADPRQQLNDARSEERNILDQINTIDRDLHEVSGEADDLQRRISDYESSRIRHQDEVASANAILTRRREEVSNRVGALYRLQRRGLARLVFGAEDASELRRRMRYLRALVQGDAGHMADFQENLARRKLAMEAMEQDVASLTALRAELKLKEADLRDQRSQRTTLLDDIRSRKDLAMRALSEQARARKGLSNRLTPEARPIQPTIDPSSAATSVNFRSLHGKLPWPTSGRVIRRFGRYQDTYTGERANSMGIDIAADFGTPFRAVAAGTVKLAEFISGYGQTVAIEHGPYTTVYAHANNLMVRRGQLIKAGQQLGSVGNSGLTSETGNVLTFEIRYNGTPQDPIPWLSAR